MKQILTQCLQNIYPTTPEYRIVGPWEVTVKNYSPILAVLFCLLSSQFTRICHIQEYIFMKNLFRIEEINHSLETHQQLNLIMNEK